MKLKNTLRLLIGILAALLIFVSPAAVLAQTTSDEACEGVAIAGGNCDDPENDRKVDSLVSQVVNVLSVVVGIVATIMIMLGGFKYVTSNGDSNQISSAKNTILYAIVGIVVVVFAQVIVRFVINKV
jgi:ABC-type Fe3+ transport system permease subunit